MDHAEIFLLSNYFIYKKKLGVALAQKSKSGRAYIRIRFSPITVPDETFQKLDVQWWTGGTQPPVRAPCVPVAELGTFGIFNIFNNKNDFFAFFFKIITDFCTSPI